MDEVIKTNTNRMNQDVISITESVNRISGYYADLVQKKAELDGMWDGAASEEFKTVFNDDLVVLMTMIDNLKKIYSFENMAKECYESCETQVAGVISDI